MNRRRIGAARIIGGTNTLYEIIAERLSYGARAKNIWLSIKRERGGMWHWTVGLLLLLGALTATNANGARAAASTQLDAPATVTVGAEFVVHAAIDDENAMAFDLVVQRSLLFELIGVADPQGVMTPTLTEGASAYRIQSSFGRRVDLTVRAIALGEATLVVGGAYEALSFTGSEPTTGSVDFLVTPLPAAGVLAGSAFAALGLLSYRSRRNA